MVLDGQPANNMVTGDNPGAEEGDISQTLLNSFLHTLPVPVLLTKRDGSILSVNTVFSRLFGYTAHDIPTIARFTEVSCQDSGCSSQILQAVRSTPDPGSPYPGWNSPGSIPVTVAGGATCWMELSISQLQEYLIIIFIDMTFQRQTELTLRQKESQIHAIIDSNNSGIIFADKEGKILYSNQAFQQLIGYSKDEIKGRNLSDFTAREDRETERRYIEVISKGRSGPSLVEVRFQTRSGGEVWVSLTVSVIADSDEGDVRYVGIVQDVTGRIVSEQELQKIDADLKANLAELTRSQELLNEKNEELSRFFTVNLDLLCIANSEGYLVRINKAWETTLGYTEKELMERPYLDFVHPDDVERTREVMKRLSEQNEIIDFVNRYRRKDGRYVWIEWRSFPFGDVIYAAARDITDRKKVELELEKSRKALAEAQKMARIGSFRINVPELTSSWSEGMYYLHRRPHSLSPDSVDDYYSRVHPDDKEIFEELRRRASEEKGSIEDEMRVIRDDGVQIWVWVRAEAITSSAGEVIAFVGTMQDITERKMNELALKRVNEKLNLLSSINRHDVLNQLTALLGYLEISLEEATDPNQIRMIQREMVAAQQITRLIKFTKDYQDIGIQAPRWFELERLVQKSVHVFTMSGIELVTKVPDAWVYADALLEKVFYNLADNSIRHGETVTRITITGEETPDGYLIIYQDNGRGIDDADRKNLFTRGFGKNTGMGLFIIREILSITGISIIENGKEGEGVRFDILIPAESYRFSSSPAT